MRHTCIPIEKAIEEHKEFQIRLDIAIRRDEDINEFCIVVWTHDLYSDRIISINEISGIKCCPYCGSKLG
ncbi:hypothetical protein J2Z66_005155 [Paenibacillus eucommiae]|uniref:Uncharacterized protein n=1 Tax=Paenibacillus eucommiae TaxID=1355755 RepID=A0ABS4J115_9BACL|nr:hypothetical protein [Paenibacillus eucommiae]